MNKQPWIGKPITDIVFILLPPFISLLIIILFPSLFKDNQEMPEMGWLLLVLLIDVAHVYSTLYRTYFDPKALTQHRSLLWAIPFFSFVASVLLYSIDHLLFWRLLAYVAVFHFVRQQYGFMRVYSRRETKESLSAGMDKVTIYAAALYPVLYWHMKGPRNFNWFVEGDFFFFQSGLLMSVATAAYVIVLLLYITKELYQLFRHKKINIPKVAIITGTAASWYFGIVYFNGDMAFTLLNVVSHGIPYMALVWLFGRKNYTQPEKGNQFLKLVFGRFGLILFLLLVFLFAFIEEGLWDVAVWKEHKTIFGPLHRIDISLSDPLLSVIVPFLALPQITHYVLDGFIWKIKQDDFKWNNEVKT